MQVKITPLPPGHYVVAVSGGVDSMVLLDVLAHAPDLTLTVAHFEHGIRADSDDDRQFVEAAAERYGLPFVTAHGNLGQGVSEAVARRARYAFLERVRAEQEAAAIITAHHQDDALETALINVLRGTGRKGLTALANRPHILRPLLQTPKSDIRAYALARSIAWREDSTNTEDTYLRNYLRHHILPKMTAAQRSQLLAHIDNLTQLNKEIDTVLQEQLAGAPGELGRQWFIMLPYDVSTEAMAAYLRAGGVSGFDRLAIHRLVVAAKTLRPGKRASVLAGHSLQIEKNTVRMVFSSDS